MVEPAGPFCDVSWERFTRIQWLNAYVVGLYFVAPLPYVLMVAVAGEALLESLERSSQQENPPLLPMMACCPCFVLVVVQFVLAVRAISPLKEEQPRRYRTAWIVLGLSKLCCQNTSFAMLPLLLMGDAPAPPTSEAFVALLMVLGGGFLIPTSFYLALHYGLLWNFYAAVFQHRRTAVPVEQQELREADHKDQLEQAFNDARAALRHQLQLELDHECENAREAKMPDHALKERVKGLVLTSRQTLCQQEEVLVRDYMDKPAFADGKPSVDRQLLELREELLSVVSIRGEVQRQLEDA